MSVSASRKIVWIYGWIRRILIHKSVSDCNAYLISTKQFIHTWTGAVLARWNKTGASGACGEHNGTHNVSCKFVSRSGKAPWANSWR
jgi:hypothetical protein